MRTLFLRLFFISTLPFATVSATEQAFPKTAPGTIEFKTLPASTLIANQSEKDYFDDNNGLFRPLFRYIQKNDIAMTTPVEADMKPGIMYFYMGSEVDTESLKGTEEVTVHKRPERRVASIGVRGSYSENNFIEAQAKLEAWLQSQEEYTASGPARGVFWNGPFTLGFMKSFEVHIPIERAEKNG